MSWKLVEFDVLKQVIADQNREFAAKDVSEDGRMTQTHAQLTKHSHYHAFVGTALSQHHLALGINLVRKGTSRGARWEKNGLARPAVPSTVKMSVAASESSQQHLSTLGPQYRKDSAFAARMRLHQSWYRAHVLGVSCGTGPKSTDTSQYGNMLTCADADTGCNFLTPEIAQVARDRVAQGSHGVEPFRLFHNMLSSQPMCFNLFGPLVNDRVLARQLLAPLVTEDVAEVTRVAVEWAPEPSDAYLQDHTSFDAFIEYRTTDNRLCALGIETKLTEPFSQNEYDGDRYRRWMRVADAPWRPEADATVHQIQHNQLWRDHLLAIALRHQPNSTYAKTRLMVIRHPGDHDCARVLADYRKLLRDQDDSLIDMPLDHLVDAWTAVIATGSRHSWIHDFRVRYLDLAKSAMRVVT